MKKYSVADAANHYVEYDMIQAHTAIPSYSELRLQLLHTVLDHSHHEKRKSELFSLVTALVQLGMDTHDLIDTETEYLTETKMRSRQLKVLAGDYFSARFYHLLAKAGEIYLVGKLSLAVANVNRLKISLYEKTKSASILADDYIKEKIHINSELFSQFTDYIDQALQPAWNTLLPLITKFEIVYDELERTTYNEGYAKSYAYWLIHEKTLNEKLKFSSEEEMQKLIVEHNVKNNLIDLLDTTMYQIENSIAHNDQLQTQLHCLLEQLNIRLLKYVVK